MKAALVLLLGLIWTASPLLQAQTSPAGRWEGPIHMATQDVMVRVDLAKNASGVWIGSLTVSGTTAIDVPVTDIVVEGERVKFSAGLLEAPVFDGRISADGIAGSASDARGAVAFELKRTGEANVKVPAPSSPLSRAFEGTWQTTVTAGETTRQITLTLSAAADGTAKAVLRRTGQPPVPVTTVTIKDSELTIESPAVSGRFKGTLGAGGELAGEWTQGPVRVPMTFRR